jgi:hypothetical protein
MTTRRGRRWRPTLPPQRQRVYDFIVAEISAQRGFPTNAAIARHMGWRHPSSARDTLDKLRADGRLEWQWYDGERHYALAAKPEDAE